MPESKSSSNALRRAAEAFLGTNTEETPTMATADIKKLVHELAVHQIELEMQNEELREAQIELAHSRDAYAELYDFAPVGYLTLDRDGTILEANQTAAIMLGVERLNLLHRKFSDFVARDAQDDWFLYRREALAYQEKQAVELPLRISDDVPLTARLECRPRPGATDGDWRCLMVLSDVSGRVQAEEALRKLNEVLEQRVEDRTSELRRLASELSLAEQRERQRIAGELHNEMGQLLSCAFMRLDTIRQSPLPEDTRASIDRAYEVLDLIMKEIRSLTFEISCPMLNELGLDAAMDELCKDMTQEHSIQFQYRGDTTPLPLSMPRKIALYRAARELLLNVMKHSEAQRAWVTLERIGQNVQIRVEDNGKGFDASEAGIGFSPSGGFGLFSIGEYVKHVGGCMEIQSLADSGTVAVLSMPLEEQKRQKTD